MNVFMEKPAFTRCSAYASAMACGSRFGVASTSVLESGKTLIICASTKSPPRSRDGSYGVTASARDALSAPMVSVALRAGSARSAQADRQAPIRVRRLERVHFIPLSLRLQHG